MNDKSTSVNGNGPKASEQSSKPSTAKKKKKVDGTFAEAWKPEREGETLSGLYLGAQDALGKKGTFKAYHIKDANGKRWSVSGTSLNTIMPQIPRKTEIVIVFKGTVEQGKGDMKVFDVEVPDDVDLIDPFADDDDND